MANKIERIQSLIRKNISEIIQFEIKSPKLGFVSIPEVKVSTDYSHAKVYVSFFNDEEAKEGMKILNKCRGFIRKELASRMDIRHVPEITFVLDDGYKKEERISELLSGK